VWSLTYLAVSHVSPGSFNVRLDKISAAYFTVTTLSTVGYGDIVPLTHTTEILGTVQMLLDLVVVAVTARLLVRTATSARERLRSSEVAEHADG
jgi:voltage-gated potassium channel Kch